MTCTIYKVRFTMYNWGKKVSSYAPMGHLKVPQATANETKSLLTQAQHHYAPEGVIL
jgi:hypothetical protein